ncbi:MAG: hypothetical protein QOK19_577 [Solirubrobacteraceae bacterium]|jgi:hypothetical protein|nr:hypothetical protein [Solirubrobacteraceae bacterium]
MFRLVRGRTLLLLAALLCAAAAGAFAVVSGDEEDPRAQLARATTAAGCGSESAPTVAAVQSEVARRIYTSELRGTETMLDTARIRSYAPLLSALEHGETAAVAAAVHALVYKPAWHIVRLRVTRGSRVLADVGGPHVIAPVTGTLRSHGRTLGHYVTSVQDDLGYVKLVTRFIGAPVDLYQRGSFVMGTLLPAPSAPRDGATVKVGGRSYLVTNVAATAFPAGRLQASLFVGQPPSGRSCSALRVAAWGSVARHIALRLKPLSTHYEALASVMRAVTGGHVFVRAGSKHLVGGGPRRIPSTGTVSYAGRTWPVYSWQPAAGQRVYFLTPPG